MTSKYLSIEQGYSTRTYLASGQRVRVINSNGGQVVDTWAFQADDLSEHLSMAHSRTALYRLWFQPGDILVSSRFRQIIRIVADTSPGKHDTLHAACSEGSYGFFGHGKNHRNCQDNLLQELSLLDYRPDNIPDPWNLFEHALIDEHMSLYDVPATAKCGDFVELEALQNLWLICSACPSTVGKISGDCPSGATIEVLS
ncbi:MAG: urea carboxylase-associated family protein [Pseudomonadota bacterium]